VASGALASYVALLGTSCSTDEQFLAAQGLWSIATKCADDVRNQENCVAGNPLSLCMFYLIPLFIVNDSENSR